MAVNISRDSHPQIARSRDHQIIELSARRVLVPLRRGNSWPVIADTAAGPFVIKLRGAAHGTAALVAEILVAGIAERIGLQVPARALVLCADDLRSDDRNDELAQLLSASRGLNLGFQFLQDAHDLRPQDAGQIDDETAVRILWLDWLTMNPDRTDRNPNILMSFGRPWLIDHGSALGFHYTWAAVTEASPLKPFPLTTHVLRTRADRIAGMHETLRSQLSRDAIRAAVAAVPDDFLQTMRPEDSGQAALFRRREAYVAFLWKRVRKAQIG